MTTNPGFKVTVYTHKSNITKTVGFTDKVTTLPQTPSWIKAFKGVASRQGWEGERIGRVKGWEGRGRRREGTERERGRREGERGQKEWEGRDGKGRKREREEKGYSPKLKFMAPPLFRLVLGLGLGSVLGLGLPTA